MDVDQYDKIRPDILLRIAVRKGDINEIQRIIEHLIRTGRRELVAADDLITETCSHRFKNDDDPKIVQLLIQNGDNVNARDKDGRTCLMIAITWNLEICRCLLNLGADVNAKDNSGNTALKYAIESTKFSWREKHTTDAVRLLRESGADINKECNSDSDTPLMLTASNRDIECCEYLLSEGANVNATNSRNETALHRVLKESFIHSAEKRNCKLDLIKLLVSNGADVHKEDEHGLDVLKASVYFPRNNPHNPFPNPVFDFLVNLDSVSIEEKADTYDLIGCVFFLNCCILLFQERQFQSNGFHTGIKDENSEYSEDFEYRSLHYKFEEKQGIEMWKKAIEIRDGKICPNECNSNPEDIETMVQIPINMLLQIVYKIQRILFTGRTEETKTYLAKQIFTEFENKETYYTLLQEFLKNPKVDFHWAKYVMKECKDDYFHQKFSILRQLVSLTKETEKRNISPIDVDESIVDIISSIYIEYLQKEKSLFEDLAVGESLLLHILSATYKFSYFFSKIFQLLFEFGFDVNRKDGTGKTVLHHLIERPARNGRHYKEDQEKLIVKLVFDQVHHAACARNNDGIKAFEILKDKFGYSDGDILEKRSLQCLASCAIVDHGIRYETRIPKKLHKFIQMH